MTIWIVEQRVCRGGRWFLRMSFETRELARGHIAGCIRNANISKGNLRVRAYVPREQRAT